jgi:hypothetical protein
LNEEINLCCNRIGEDMIIKEHLTQLDARNAALLDCEQDSTARMSMFTAGYLVIRKYGPPTFHRCEMHEYGADH